MIFINDPHPSTQAFWQSLTVLAQIAVRETGGDGFSYFRFESGKPIRSNAFGKWIAEEALSGEGVPTAASFPLRLGAALDGMLVFSFPTKEKCENAKALLNKLAATIRKVWAAASIAQTYHGVLECIVALETELIESKIVSYARGLQTGISDQTLADVISRHVDSVLRPSATMRALNQTLRELQEKVEERNWTIQAKAILQNANGMTEEEAYFHLRRVSRHSRMRFVDVARQVVEGRFEADQYKQGIPT